MKKIYWAIIILIMLSSNLSCSIITDSSNKADIKAYVYITPEVLMSKTGSSKQDTIKPTVSNSYLWVVNISVKNKGYSQPISGKPMYWGINIQDAGRVQSSEIIKDKNSQIQIELGKSGQFTTFFQIHDTYSINNAKLEYMAQEPRSSCLLTGGYKFDAYDMDADTPMGSPIPYTPVPPSPKPTTSEPEGQKPVAYSHTGFVKMASTGNNQTTIVFQDGFVVQFVGSMRVELLPAIGSKIEVKYVYSSNAGGNVLTSLQAVP